MADNSGNVLFTGSEMADLTPSTDADESLRIITKGRQILWIPLYGQRLLDTWPSHLILVDIPSATKKKVQASPMSPHHIRAPFTSKVLPSHQSRLYIRDPPIT